MKFDVSQITDYLYLSAFPHRRDAWFIQEADIRLILSMHWIKPSRTIAQPPVQLLWLPTIDQPFTPMPISILCRGVEGALPVIDANHNVLVHCRAGVHRSVAMACCVLIGMGFTAEEAMQLVKERREVADPDIWYIRKRIIKFEETWKQNRIS